MSVTSALADPEHALTALFAVELPNRWGVARRTGIITARRQRACGWAEGGVPAPWPLLGTAIDLRLRASLRAPELELPTLVGAGAVDATGHLVAELKTAVRDAAALGAHERGSRLLLPQPAERQLSRLCVVLAWLDAVGRSGLPQGEPDPVEDPPLAQGDSDLQSIMGRIADGYLEDLRSVVDAASRGDFASLRRTTEPTDVRTATIPSAAFLVGGGDVDWICRDILVECKATMRSNAWDPWQLAAYVLLDPDNALGVRHVAVYLARFATLICWPIDVFLTRLAGRSVNRGELGARVLSSLASDSLL